MLTALNTPTETSFPPQTKVLLVFALAIGVSYVSASRQLISSRQAAQAPNAKDVLLRRYEQLTRVLPATGTVGYLPDAQRAERQPIHPDARFGLLRYALVPRLLEPTAEAAFIVFDSDRPSAAPDGPLADSLDLVADFQDGLKVFRRRRTVGQ